MFLPEKKKTKISSIIISSLIIFAFCVFISLYAFKAIPLPGSVKNYGLEIYKFDFSEKDIIFFDKCLKKNIKMRYKTKESFNKKKVALLYKNKKFKVKISLRGDGANHWNDSKVSFKMALKKKSGAINNRTKWSFIIPCDRYFFIPEISSFLAKILGLPFVKTQLVVVESNYEKMNGLYLLEESVNEEFLETKNLSNSFIVKIASHWASDHPLGFDLSNPQTLVDSWDYGLEYCHGSALNLNISNLDTIKSKNVDSSYIYNQMGKLFTAIEEKDYLKINNMIDIKNIGAVMSMVALMGSNHDIAGDNLRLVYSLTNGRISLIPRFEGMLEKISIDKGSFEHCISANKFNPMLFNNQVRNNMYFNIAKLIEKKEEILSFYSSLMKKYIPAILRDKTALSKYRTTERALKKRYKRLKRNFSVLESLLSYSRCYIDIVEENNNIDIEIIPDSNMPLYCRQFDLIFKNENYNNFVSIDVFNEHGILMKNIRKDVVGGVLSIENIVNKNILIPELDETLHIKKTGYHYKITGLNRNKIKIKDINVKMQNNITLKVLKQDEIYIGIADNRGAEDEKLKNLSWDKFLERYNYLPFFINKDVLVLKQGQYILRENLIIPSGKKVIIEQGVDIKIYPGKSIVSYSPIKINGTEEFPVKIRAYDPLKPFGTFAVVGGLNKEKCYINYLDISGGSEKLINGMFFSGALCIYHMDLDMETCNVYNNFADDGLNVKYGSVYLKNNRFYNNFADQVDLDFTEGSIIKNEFSLRNKNDLNGDGLDLSGSYVLLRDNVFLNHRDKGISIGEASSVILYSNKISNNNIGAAIKDSSKAVLIDNIFSNNRTVLSLYRKKLIFNGSSVYLFFNKLEKNGQLEQVDEFSKIYKLKDKQYENKLNKLLLLDEIKKINIVDFIDICE